MLVLTLLFFWPQLVRGRILYWGDIGLYFLPMTSFLHDNLRAGHLPLWNPFVLCGTPFVGNPQTWPAYPLSWLLPFVSAGYFLNLTVAFHIWLTACGTFLFLRRAEQLSGKASLLGATVFAFGGQLVSKEQFPNMVQAIAWLPLILYAVHHLAARRRWGNAVWLGVALGLQLLAAHAQMTLLTLYLAAAYGVRQWVSAPVRPVFWAFAARLALAGTIALGLCAVQVLPTLELYQNAWRQNLSFPIVNRFFLPPNQLANFVLPTLHGHPYWGDFTARGNFWETCCYVGALGFALAVVGTVWAWRAPKHSSEVSNLARFGMGFPGLLWLPQHCLSIACALLRRGERIPTTEETVPSLVQAGNALAMPPQRGEDRVKLDASHSSTRFWTVVVLVGVWLATGGWGGLYHAAYVALPGFHSFHDPARCLLWSAWGVSVLAAFGYERCQRLVRLPLARRALFAACLLLIFGDLAHFGRTLYPLASPAALLRPALFPPADAAEFQAHQARVLAPDSARVWQRFTSHRAFRQDAPGFGARWVQTLTPNLPMLFSLPDAFGYEPLARWDAQRVSSMAADALRPNASPAQRRRAMALAGMLGVRTVVFYRARSPGETLPNALPVLSLPTLPPTGRAEPTGRAGDATRVYVCRNALWQPRARLTTRFVSVPTRAAAFALLSPAAHSPTPVNLASTAVVVGQTGFASVSGGGVPAPIVVDTPDEVVVQAHNAAPALLVLADTLHPGWHATVDGRSVPLLSADGFLRAVPLPSPGAHRVVFKYRPTSFLLGCYVSLLTWGGLAAYSAFRIIKQRLFFAARQEFPRPIANSRAEQA